LEMKRLQAVRRGNLFTPVVESDAVDTVLTLITRPAGPALAGRRPIHSQQCVVRPCALPAKAGPTNPDPERIVNGLSSRAGLTNVETRFLGLAGATFEGFKLLLGLGTGQQ